ncbi:helix-turn-helix domain-containing protein [Nocardia concava]|uniref:helix-turn-helix domain-containing protein n=1 Tax=Nocardia concava TaxID=257281 RepID=UPI000593C748|nr:helix-turn-helix transcriptional regulator [Nocardia concava]
MTSSANSLRAARLSLGYRSQEALAEALNKTAREIGLRIAINKRTVRRWESAEPPWPQAEHIMALESLFGRPISELGFGSARRAGSDQPPRPQAGGNRESWASRHSGAADGVLPQSVASDFMSATAAHRRMYWSVPAARLQRLVAEHAALGWDLLPQIPGAAKTLMARAVAESGLLAGRLEFFDLQQPDLAGPSFGLALQAAGQADDPLLGAAILAHMAFAPAFSGDPERAEEARDKIRGARTFAVRGNAGAEMLAWIDAVEAEVETRFGDVAAALRLIEHAEQEYGRYALDHNVSPPWLDWFSPTRLAGFKGNTQLAAGDGTAARETLERALADLSVEAIKQRAVFLADLAAAAVLERDPEQACVYLNDALGLLGEHWYATAMDRVKAVRRSLREWDALPSVRELDGQLYNWHTMIRSLAT